MRLQRLLVVSLLCGGTIPAGFLGPATVSGGPARADEPAAQPAVGTGTTATTAAASAAVSPSTSGTGAAPAIHAIYPDPVRGGDQGEFVVLSLPNGSALGQYAVTDGDTTAALPNLTVSGRVAVTDAPRSVRNLTDYQVVGLDSAPKLANGGDSVALLRNDTTVARVRYSDTEEGELGVVTGATIRWRPLGATDRPVVTGGPGDVRAFTLPDAPQAPLAPIRNASSRVYLAGYTLSSGRVADALLAAQRRGAEVRVLLEGDPVGGRTRAEATTLDRLDEAGIEARVLHRPRARDRPHHPK